MSSSLLASGTTGSALATTGGTATFRSSTSRATITASGSALSASATPFGTPRPSASPSFTLPGPSATSAPIPAQPSSPALAPGVIVGITLGGLAAFVALVWFAIWLAYRPRLRRERDEDLRAKGSVASSNASTAGSPALSASSDPSHLESAQANNVAGRRGPIAPVPEMIQISNGSGSGRTRRTPPPLNTTQSVGASPTFESALSTTSITTLLGNQAVSPSSAANETSPTSPTAGPSSRPIRDRTSLPVPGASSSSAPPRPVYAAPSQTSLSSAVKIPSPLSQAPPITADSDSEEQQGGKGKEKAPEEGAGNGMEPPSPADEGFHRRLDEMEQAIVELAESIRGSSKSRQVSPKGSPKRSASPGPAGAADLPPKAPETAQHTSSAPDTSSEPDNSSVEPTASGVTRVSSRRIGSVSSK